MFAKCQKNDDKLTSQDQICEDQINVEDFKTFIMVKKRKQDKALPKKNDELKLRWRQVKFLLEVSNEDHLLEQEYEQYEVASVLAALAI